MFHEERAVPFAHADEIQSAILGCGLRSEVKRRADRSNVNRLPKNVAIRNVFAVDFDLPFLGQIFAQHVSQQRNVPRHLLFFRKLFGFLCFGFRVAKIVREQTAPDAFKKKSLAPRSTRDAYVKRAPFCAFEPGNDFFGRGDEDRL
jgi:hypothetical protein